jgi:hypothetical protein
VGIHVNFEIEFRNLKVKTPKLILRKGINIVSKSMSQLKAEYYFLVIKICDLAINMQVEFKTVMREIWIKFGNWLCIDSKSDTEMEFD